MSLITQYLNPLRAVSPDFQQWLDDHALAESDVQRMTEKLDELPYKPVISVVIPVFNPSETYLREAIDSVRAQFYPHWELCIADDHSTAPHVRSILEDYAAKDSRIKVIFRQTNGRIAVASNSALELATGEFVALMDHDDCLPFNALYEICVCLNQHPETDMIYTDEALMDDDHRLRTPLFKPDWCPDYFLSVMYTCHLGVYRRSLITQIGGFRDGFEGSQDYDLVLRLTEQTKHIQHIPKLLYYWRFHPGSATSGMDAKDYAYEAAERAISEALIRRHEPGWVGRLTSDEIGSYIIRYEIRSHGRVSVIIPTRDRADLLARCLESLFTKTTYPDYEVILVDNGSVEQATHQLIAYWQANAPVPFQHLRLDVPFNFSALNNEAVRHARGEYLLFLNNDTEIIVEDWLEAMVEQAQRPTIGAVGATLFYSDGKIQHAGIGLYAAPGNIKSSSLQIKNCSAISAACLMCRRNVFEEVGGFNEALPIAFNDVDLCLQMVEQGYRNVCLPHVQLFHHESKSRGLEDTPEKLSRLSKELEWFFQKWLKYVRHDPCHSPYHFWRIYHADFDYSMSVVVPWWDHTEFLDLWERNMEHLRHAQVIFIDNGSQPEGAKALREFCDRHHVTLIRNATNLGFAAANNQGLAIATGTFLLHLNNDLEIVDLPWAFLCASAREGISGSGPCQNELGIRYVEGWALCANRRTLQRLGGWTEDYGPGYWDDVDLCYRFTKAGYQMVPVPSLKQMIRHITNATGRDGRLDQIALHLRNRGRFIQKYLRTYPKIMIDGVFFQRYKTGIARVWRTLMEEWASMDFAQHLVLLDRAGTAPMVSGIRTRQIPPHDYNRLEDDRELLQELCDEEGADLFISTYYSTPLSTPSVLMVHDMIPEVAATKDSDVNLDDFMWREKRQAIQQAAAYITVSENTARDLIRFFPEIDPARVTIAKEGVSPVFQPASPEAIASLKRKYGIHKPYFLLVGSSIGYKNTILFYRSLAYLESRYGFDIVSVGSGGILEDEFRACTEGMTVHLLRLSDQELAAAYSGAIALVYPSQYEGFGLPIVEAMACGCPVITCANGSIPEVAGDAVVYVDDADVLAMAEALCEVQKPSVRQRLSSAGQEQAAQFSWTKMAKIVADALIDATLLALNLGQYNLILFPDWTQPEDAIAASLAEALQHIAIQVDNSPTLLIDTTKSQPETVDELLSNVIMALALEEGLDVTESIQISLLPKLGEVQWQVLAPRLAARVPIALENSDAIKAAGLEQLDVWTVEFV